MSFGPDGLVAMFAGVQWEVLANPVSADVDDRRALWEYAAIDSDAVLVDPSGAADTTNSAERGSFVLSAVRIEADGAERFVRSALADGKILEKPDLLQAVLAVRIAEPDPRGFDHMAVSIVQVVAHVVPESERRSLGLPVSYIYTYCLPATVHAMLVAKRADWGAEERIHLEQDSCSWECMTGHLDQKETEERTQVAVH